MKQDIEALLEKFRNELGLVLGSNLEQVVLYGSDASRALSKPRNLLLPDWTALKERFVAIFPAPPAIP